MNHRIFASLAIAATAWGFTTADTRSADSETATPQGSVAAVAAESRIEALMQRVVSDLQAKRYGTALELLSAAGPDVESNPFFQNAKAAALIQLKRYDEARPILISLLQNDAQFFQADYNLGEISFLQGDHEAAREHFRRMQRVHGDVPLLRYKILLCDLLVGEDRNAESAARAFRYPAETPAWYFAQAAVAAHSGDRSTARQLIDTATRIHGEQETAVFRETLRDSGILR